MIYIYLNGHEEMNSVQTAVQIFMPNEKYKPVECVQNEGTTVKSSINGNNVTAELYENGEQVCARNEEIDWRGKRHALNSSVYHMLKEKTGQYTPWGMMTGIRPAKSINTYIDNGLSVEESIRRLIGVFEITRPKAELAAKVALAERDILKKADSGGISLYIGIPFCPTRCLYCSFTSYPLDKYSGKVDAYIEALIKELRFIGEKAKGKRLDSIYIGGGTPTSLSAQQLDTLMGSASEIFDTDRLLEYTVEAGRPDTITPEKLAVINKNGAGRISINPQTMNDKTLQLIGRKHSVDDIKRVYYEARESGHKNINMDLIAGLPGDTFSSFKNSVDTAVSLGASSITEHTLAMKSSAYLVTSENKYDLSDKLLTSDMVEYSNEKLKQNGYYPYYMYRQSKSVGNLENVGWCKDNKDCLYNVYMMDETHSVFAVGAGGVTRLKNQDTGKIERIYNYKYPYEYIDRFDEILKRKDLIKEFYIK